MEEDGTFDVLTKKEVQGLRHEMEKLEKYLGGIKDMKKLPGALFIVDPRKERIAVSEARKLNIPVFALCDTSDDPELVDFPIPTNNDATSAIKLIVGVLADAVVEARAGVTEFAYVKDEGPESTMADAIRVADIAAEQHRQALRAARKAREERFAKMRAEREARFQARRAEQAKTAAGAAPAEEAKESK